MKRTVVDSVAPGGDPQVADPVVDRVPVPSGVTRGCRGTVVGSRSGDKVAMQPGVFARSAEGFAWMEQELTVHDSRVAPRSGDARDRRFELPNLWSLSFVIHGLLQEGVAASTRQDGQAKSLGVAAGSPC